MDYFEYQSKKFRPENSRQKVRVWNKPEKKPDPAIEVKESDVSPTMRERILQFWNR